MDISEVEAILRTHPFLKKPKYVFMIEEPVTARVNGMIVFKGMAPKWRKDVIILTPYATHETVVHEILHIMGLKEAGASMISKVLRTLRSFIPSVMRSEVKYIPCSGCEFVEAHKRGIKHYVLQEK